MLAGTSDVDVVGAVVVVEGSLPSVEQAPRNRAAATRRWAEMRCLSVVAYLTGERVPNTARNPRQRAQQSPQAMIGSPFPMTTSPLSVTV